MKVTNDNIIIDGDERLREISKEVSFPLTPDQKETYQSILDHVIYSQSFDDVDEENLEIMPAVGMAAVQVGILERMFAIYFEYDEEENKPPFKHIMINPVIIDSGDVVNVGPEDCLSVVETHDGDVWRHEWIRVQWFDMEGNKFSKMLTDFEAIVFQHELDHLNATLYYDRIK